MVDGHKTQINVEHLTWLICHPAHRDQNHFLYPLFLWLPHPSIFQDTPYGIRANQRNPVVGFGYFVGHTMFTPISMLVMQFQHFGFNLSRYLPSSLEGSAKNQSDVINTAYGREKNHLRMPLMP